LSVATVVGGAFAAAGLPAVVVVAAVVVSAAAVVSGAVVVTASVDAGVVSVVVEGALVVSAEVEEVVVEATSESRAENGFPSASALEAITPSRSSATSAAASLAKPNFLDLLVRSLTVLPLSLPQFFSLPLPLVRPLPAIADPSLRHGDQEATTRQRQPKGCLTRLVALPLSH